MHTATVAPVPQSQRLDVKVGGAKPEAKGSNAVDKEPMLLMPGASNTLDTLFGEVSESESEPSFSKAAPDVSAANENAVEPVNCVHSTKKPSADVEDGEITDSDSEPHMVSPANVVAAVSEKFNAIVGSSGQSVRSRCSGDVRPPGQSAPEKVPKSTSPTPSRRRVSSDQERAPSSGNRSGSGSGARRVDRKRPPPAQSREVDRKDRLTTSDVASDRDNHSAAKQRPSVRPDERRRTCENRGRDSRPLSPRKKVAQSRAAVRRSRTPAHVSSRSRGNSSARFTRPHRRY